jgi:D-alanine-D-alanine ligase
MDQKKLTKSRFHMLDDQKDGEVKKRLSGLARDVYTYFGINTLIRLDVREDAKGNLNILEVNPKPDLKKPEKDVTSIVSLGLGAQGMTYSDLILSILATRLHQLFEIQRGYIRHIIDMVND